MPICPQCGCSCMDLKPSLLPHVHVFQSYILSWRMLADGAHDTHWNLQCLGSSQSAPNLPLRRRVAIMVVLGVVAIVVMVAGPVLCTK